MASVKEATQLICQQLLSFGIEDSEVQREAQLIISSVTGKSASLLMAFPEVFLSEQELEGLYAMLERRRLREPLQYILQNTGFFGLEFTVGPGVLIPRSDTEILVEETLKQLKGKETPLLAEVGAGSGAVSISLLKSIADAKMFACEVSVDAYAIAQKNADRHGVEDRLSLALADWRQWIKTLPGPLDALVSNPPYIPFGIRTTLAPEVRDWEPDLALYGTDEDGLGFYREFSLLPSQLFKEDGFIALEFGYGQAETLKRLFAEAGWLELLIAPDLSGIARVLIARRKNTFEKA